MKYFSTFTGIGGLDMGLAGWNECVGFSEIKESSVKVYQNHYPTHKNYGDITKIDYENLPDFDILTGGFPCQAFSLAGLRKGFEDRKGQLIFNIYDLLMAKQPQFAVLENVKGLLNHDNGKTYENVFRLLQSAGYFVRVVLLNACHYGSAQSRERILFLCSKNNFEKKTPLILDGSKRFRDIIDDDDLSYKALSKTDRNEQKLQQKMQFSFELIGGYDRTGTLTTQYGCGEKAVQWDDWWRYLTVLECERLQGFPDKWTEGISAGNRYFALGNAVNCHVSNYLFKDYLKGLWW
jgi:DNA-cytosine methyltransferase